MRYGSYRAQTRELEPLTQIQRHESEPLVSHGPIQTRDPPLAPHGCQNQIQVLVAALVILQARWVPLKNLVWFWSGLWFGLNKPRSLLDVVLYRGSNPGRETVWIYLDDSERF